MTLKEIFDKDGYTCGNLDIDSFEIDNVKDGVETGEVAKTI